MANAPLAAGTPVWVPNPSKTPKASPFLRGEVVSASDESCSVRLCESDSEVQVKTASVDVANDISRFGEAERTEADNCDLLNLSEATLLHNTKLRFLADNIYTFTGKIVTSLNPCTPLPHLYSEETMREARDATTMRDAVPHLFSLAEAAYTNMRELGRDQSIVVSGVSGAGKTEANKHIMRYLCWRAHGVVGEPSSSAGENAWAPLARGVHAVETPAPGILASNPLFEALGNSATVNNPNSSRFGKFIQIYFDETTGGLASASIATYLLEKSRLAVHQPGERNFHIFHQILAGAAPQTLASLELDGRHASAFHYLAEPKASAVGGVGLAGSMAEGGEKAAVDAPFAERLDDAAEYAQTAGAMAELGLDAAPLLRLLAGVLHLGDVAFEAVPGDDEAAQPTAEGQAALARAERLLGVAQLGRALTQRVVQAGGGRTSVYNVPLNVDGAAFARDALAKRLYARAFDHTVTHINSALRGAPDAAAGASAGTAEARRWMGLLDVFGFEIFPTNSFEQLMARPRVKTDRAPYPPACIPLDWPLVALTAFGAVPRRHAAA